ncbi:MAG TPA: SAM-dependent DNA methyltransferase, partial [Methylomirabilota bacterium]|nr:SAM-dependent DNA methyltransferase [Methylomirabilota bacterium]
QIWNHFSLLGAGAFETIGGEVVNTVLLILTNQLPDDKQVFTGIDASKSRIAHMKARLLLEMPLKTVRQANQVQNPDARVSLQELRGTQLLADYASIHEGMSRGDTERFDRKFWEIKQIDSIWSFLLNSPQSNDPYSGREHIVFWEQGEGTLASSSQARVTGKAAWRKIGVFVARTSDLKCTLSLGEMHAQNGAVILPKKPEYLPPIWAFCCSTEYREAVKKLNDKIIVASGTLNQVPFDIEYWREIADAAGPIPEPYSNDPTQWLFKGNPVDSTEPLQVAVVRLLGYSWPQQKPDNLDNYTVQEGIICLPSIAGEEQAVERLRALLAQAYGEAWSPMQQDRLLAEVGFGGKSLDVWLYDGFFIQH